MRRRFPWAIVYLGMFAAGVIVAYSLSSFETQQTIANALRGILGF